MPFDGKHIDQVVKEKAESFNAGNAAWEADWNRIKSALPRAAENNAPPKTTGRIKLFRLFAAAAAVALLFFVLRNTFTGSTEKEKITPVAVTPKDTVRTVAPVTTGDTSSKLPPGYIFMPHPVDWDWMKDFKPVISSVPLPSGYKPEKIVRDSGSGIFIQPEPNAAILLANFYAEAEPKAQTFTINNQQEQTLNCKQGTEIFIPANTFYRGGQPVNGEVTVLVNEYYSLGDMVAAKLSTTSGGELLQSGGMLFINASYNNGPVYIGGGKTIDVTMPAKNGFDPEMQLFVPATMDVARKATIKDTPKQNTVPQEEPASPGADTLAAARPFTLFWGQTTNVDGFAADFSMDGGAGFQWIPAGQMQDNPGGKERAESFKPMAKVATVMVLQPYKLSGNQATYLTGHLDEWEKDSIRAILKRLHADYDIKLRSAFVGAKQFITQTDDRLPQYIESRYDSTWVPLEYALTNNLVDTAQGNRILREYQRRQRYNEGMKVFENKYKFELDKLGWINCDRFYSDPREKIAYTVNLGADPADFVVRLVFPRLNALTSLSVQKEQTVMFPNLPLGEPVTVVAIGIRNGKTVGCFVKTQLSREGIGNLPYEAIDTNGFKEKLKQLDNTQ